MQSPDAKVFVQTIDQDHKPVYDFDHGTMCKQDYYLADAKWTESFDRHTYEKKNVLTVKINKLRQPYSQPENVDATDDSVIEEHSDMLAFDSKEDSE